MTITRHPVSETRPPPGRRAGYLVAVVVNAALLVVVDRILDWGLLPFLTDSFRRVVPLVTVSLAATILVNVVYLGYDPQWFRSLTQIGLSAIALAVTARILAVFPFDFGTTGYDWSTLVRVLLLLAMVGLVIAIVVEGVRLVVSLIRG